MCNETAGRLRSLIHRSDDRAVQVSVTFDAKETSKLTLWSTEVLRDMFGSSRAFVLAVERANVLKFNSCQPRHNASRQGMRLMEPSSFVALTASFLRCSMRSCGGRWLPSAHSYIYPSVLFLDSTRSLT